MPLPPASEIHMYYAPCSQKLPENIYKIDIYLIPGGRGTFAKLPPSVISFSEKLPLFFEKIAILF
jgi:hypothetical protein